MTWIFRVATGRSVLVGLGVLVGGSVLVFGVGPFPNVSSLAPGNTLPEQQIGYRAIELHDFLASIGAEGRADYLHFQLLDILTPLIIGGPAALLIAWLLKCGGSPTGPGVWLPFIPFLLLVTEIAEDFVLGQAVLMYPANSPAAEVLSVLTLSKFAALFLTLAVVIACGLRLTWRKD